MHVFRQVFLHFFHAVVHGIGNLDVVGARLRNDYDTYHRHTVHLHVTLDVGRTQFGTADVAESDNTVVVFLEDKVVELFGGVHQSEGTDGQLGGVSFDTTRGEFHVFFVYSVLYVYRSDTVTGHLDGVQPKAHGVTFLTPDAYAADVGDGLKLFLHGEVSYFAQFQQGTLVALQGNHKDRHGVGIGFRYGRRVAVAGQIALCTRYFVAYVVGGCFQVDGEFELYCDARRTLLADAGKGTDAGNTVDVLFQGFGNLILDNIGVGTRIGAGHRYDGIIDRRVFAYTEIVVADKAKEQYYQGEYGGEYRSPYA